MLQHTTDINFLNGTATELQAIRALLPEYVNGAAALLVSYTGWTHAQAVALIEDYVEAER